MDQSNHTPVPQQSVTASAMNDPAAKIAAKAARMNRAQRFVDNRYLYLPPWVVAGTVAASDWAIATKADLVRRIAFQIFITDTIRDLQAMADEPMWQPSGELLERYNSQMARCNQLMEEGRDCLVDFDAYQIVNARFQGLNLDTTQFEPALLARIAGIEAHFGLTTGNTPGYFVAVAQNVNSSA